MLRTTLRPSTRRPQARTSDCVFPTPRHSSLSTGVDTVRWQHERWRPGLRASQEVHTATSTSWLKATYVFRETETRASHMVEKKDQGWNTTLQPPGQQKRANDTHTHTRTQTIRPPTIHNRQKNKHREPPSHTSPRSPGSHPHAVPQPSGRTHESQ